MKPTLFFDMDGVLTEFYENPNWYEEMFQEGYFRSLKPTALVDEVAKLYLLHGSLFNFYILSAYNPEAHTCVVEKNEWLDRHLPMIHQNNRIFCQVFTNKSDYIPQGIEMPILFDDYSKNIYEWEAKGYYAVKVKNHINFKDEGKIYRNVLHDATAEGIINTVFHLK